MTYTSIRVFKNYSLKMAQIQDWKSNLYSRKQSVQDEASVPQFLESAGDVFIKTLAKKQTETATTLKEQLEIVQNFEKGFDLNPDDEKGINSFETFKRKMLEKNEGGGESAEMTPEMDLEELKKLTGLSRHELELTLSEKPNSLTSKLYQFAIMNKTVKRKEDSLESRLPDHPINHLKELEEEHFGFLYKKKSKSEPEESVEGEVSKIETKQKKHKRKRKRQKKKPVCDTNEGVRISKRDEDKTVNESSTQEDVPKSSVRPSLWDVKDMKKWSESKIVGCKPRTWYTIENGKIIKLEGKQPAENS